MVTCGVDTETGERLARAGFAVVTVEPPGALDEVLRALRGGELGPRPKGIGVVIKGVEAKGVKAVGVECEGVTATARAAGVAVVTLDDGLDEAIRRLAEALT